MIVRNAGLGKRGSMQCGCCGKDICVILWEKSTKKYCSKECKNKMSLVARMPVTCSLDGCSNVFFRTEKQIAKTQKHYCTNKCTSIAGRLVAQDSGKKTGTKPELLFKKWCEDNEIEFTHQYSVLWKRGWKKWYDFYLPKYRLLIEIDGVYWHGKGLDDSSLNEQQSNTRKNDIEKNKLATVRGYNLLRIWEDELKNFKIEKITQL
jgi:DNA mismatch endonuclease (patch repair protein)